MASLAEILENLMIDQYKFVLCDFRRNFTPYYVNRLRLLDDAIYEVTFGQDGSQHDDKILITNFSSELKGFQSFVSQLQQSAARMAGSRIGL